MTLQLHDCLSLVHYDGKEAFYYCESEIPAGTYNFSVGAHSWLAAEVGKSYQFTLTNPVPAGGQIVFDNGYSTPFANSTVSTYKGGTGTTAIESATMTAGTTGTSLGTITNGINGNFNSCQRALIGSNNWAESAVRQYLNSDKAAGSVWSPKTEWDRPPAWVSYTAGFMNGLDADFLAVIGETEKVTTRNTFCEDGAAQTTKDKFFLLSRPEVFCGTEKTQVDEGFPYPFYADYSDYASPNADADKNRLKYLDGTAKWWLLRTPSIATSGSARTVFTTGALNSNFAYYASGIAQACNII
jgi:hypothetical protein